MRISLVRTGGVAGMRREATIDTADLGPRDSEEIHRLVSAAAGEPAPAKTPGPAGADRFHYTLTIEDGGRRRALTFAEEHTPQRLRPLLDAVWRAAEAGKSGAGPKDA